MLRTSTILAATLLLATSAFAQDVHVSIVGKDATTLHRDIAKAAYEVCKQEPETGPLYGFTDSDKEYCIQHTVQAALAAVHDRQVAQDHDRSSAPVVIGSR